MMIRVAAHLRLLQPHACGATPVLSRRYAYNRGTRDPSQHGLTLKGDLNKAIKISGGFEYWPRYPDVEDPPHEPTKLFMIKRIKPLKGQPYWDKEALKRFGLDGPVAIVKNIPSVCAALYRLKHLIKITPITFPNGLPEEGDYLGTELRENGEFVVSQKLKVDPKMLEEPSEEKKRYTMDKDTLKRRLMLEWNNPW